MRALLGRRQKHLLKGSSAWLSALDISKISFGTGATQKIGGSLNKKKKIACLQALEELVGLLWGEEELVGGEEGDGVNQQRHPEVFGRQLGPEQRVEQARRAAIVPLIHHPSNREGTGCNLNADPDPA